MFSIGVATDVGFTVLMLPQARPRRPSPDDCWNRQERVLASSMAWFLIVRPPIVTLSVLTSPDAVEESPYWICQMLPGTFLKVLDLLRSKILWLPLPED